MSIQSHYTVQATGKLAVLICLLVLGSSLAQTQVTPLVKCLGEEEFKYYSDKKQGPDYALNQYFINTLAGANNARLKPQYLEGICHNRHFPPSVALLRNLTIEGIHIFEIRTNEFQQHENHITSLWAIEEELANTFMNYLSALQGETSDPKCLIKHIPELQYFFDRLKYLENDLQAKQLLKPKSKVVDIFEKIKRFPQIKQQCSQKASADKKPKTGTGK